MYSGISTALKPASRPPGSRKMFFCARISENRYLLMFIAAMLAMPWKLQAGEAMSLRQSVALALSHNRMLGMAEQQQQVAEAGRQQATAALLPRIDVQTGVARSNSPLMVFGSKLQQQNVTAADFNPVTLNHPSYTSLYTTRLGLTMPLFAGGANWAGRRQSAHQAEASAHELQYRRQQVIFQTVAAYLRAKQAEASLAAGERAVEAARRRFEDAKALNRRGMALKSDVMDAEVHLLQSRLKLDAAKAELDNSRDALSRVLGVEMQAKSLAEPGIELQVRDADALLQQALKGRSDLLAMQEKEKAAEAGVSVSRAGMLPHVELMAQQEWNDSRWGLGNRNTTIGANVHLNLFAGGADRARMRAAEAKLISSQLRLEDQRVAIANEVRQAWRSLKLAEQRLASETRAETQTSESLRIRSLRHRQGLEKTSDLLAAQARFDQARLNRIQAQYDVELARAALLLAAGRLDEGVIR